MRSKNKNVVDRVSIWSFTSSTMGQCLNHNHQIPLEDNFLDTNFRCKLHSSSTCHRLNLSNWIRKGNTFNHSNNHLATSIVNDHSHASRVGAAEDSTIEICLKTQGVRRTPKIWRSHYTTHRQSILGIDEILQ